MVDSAKASGRLGLLAILASCCALAQTNGAALGTPAQPVRPPAGGIWKAVVPPTAMQAAFEGFDPIGIAAGARIKADCSLNWINPDDGTRYCFSSGTSLEFFLDNPNTAIERARAGWRKLAERR
jgi:hypothetical protein